jgi:hypothetical protein
LNGVEGRSLLVVPLPGLVSVVPPLGRGSTPPYVPLLDPFAEPAHLDEGVMSELRSYFADVLPFRLRLTDLSQFPGGSPYLTPDPSAPFRHLTQGVLRLFPELRPRRGMFDVVPHLDVPMGPHEDLDRLQAELDPWLPVVTVAREAALWWREEDGVRTLATFTFGTSAA